MATLILYFCMSLMVGREWRLAVLLLTVSRLISEAIYSAISFIPMPPKQRSAMCSSSLQGIDHSLGCVTSAICIEQVDTFHYKAQTMHVETGHRSCTDHEEYPSQ